MPVAVHCPTCGQELVAPNELIGQIAACPGCNAQFPISVDDGAQRAEPPPPPPSGQQPSQAARDTSDAAPPAVQGESVRELPATDAYFPPGKAPAPKSAEQPARPKQPQAPAASTARAAQPAKFIAGEATDTSIELGQDGQLPMLVLAEGISKESVEADGQKANPLILVGVLCFSLLASLSMLLLDTTAYYEEPDSKKEARTQIEAHYVRGNPLREPYQDLLAAALQAQHKGDSREEQKYYKQVSKMLREENKNIYTGLTGSVNAPKPPNDEHLDSLLRTLLR
ncbi:MAG: hypothetical protein H8E66_34040 [Planctomycetes bacterium]|nr:hypothetical protein [Planctomycetota bacterium]